MSNVSSKPPNPAPAASAVLKPVVPWGPAAGVVISFLGYFIVQFVAAVLLGAIVGIFHLYPHGDWLNSTPAQFVFVLLSDGLIVLALGLFLHRSHASFKLLGFARRPGWRDLGFALGGYAVYFIVLIVAFSLVGAFTGINLDQKQELGFETLTSVPQQLMALVSLVVLPPLVEETLFRGLLYTGLRRKLRFIWAAVWTSLLFGALHLLGTSNGLLWVAGIDTFILSMILCYLREKTDALWAPILVHCVKNSIAFALLIGVIGS